MAIQILERYNKYNKINKKKLIRFHAVNQNIENYFIFCYNVNKSN